MSRVISTGRSIRKPARARPGRCAASGAVLLLAAGVLSCRGPRPPVPVHGGKGEAATTSFLCPTRHAVVREPAMSCLEANRAAAAAIKRLGYTITEFTTASGTRRGLLRARRGARRGNHWQEHTALVTITCAAAGAEIDAVTTRGCVGQLTFPGRFRHSFAAVAERQAPPPSLVPKEQQSGLQITVRPERKGDPKLGIDLAAAGVLPIRITVHNRTARAYVIDPDGITLISQTGERTKLLSIDQAAARVARALAADTEATAARLRAHALERVVVAPGGALEAYVYARRQAYRRARIILKDKASGETEGLAVDL